MTELERNLLAAPQATSSKVEVYSGVARLAKTVWGSEVKLAGTTPTTALVWCHPTSNFLGHYALPGVAERGFGAVGLTTRYVGNDSSLIMENCLLDMGSMVDHLRASGYERVVLVGNSGGASVVPYYQAQALAPSVTSPPGGGPDLTEAALTPADAIVMFNAHPSRARTLTEMLDPAIVDELRPFERDPSLDMYDPRNGPPYSPGFIERYRAGQLARSRRISAWCEEQLAALSAPGHLPEGLTDLAFTIHGTTADLRLLDATIDPSDRPIGTTSWGHPSVANYLPAGVARFSTLRSWLNQWSVDHSLGDSLRWLPEITSPVFVGAGTADELVAPQVARRMYDAATAASSRTWVEFKEGTHYFEGRPDVLSDALDALATWLETI